MQAVKYIKPYIQRGNMLLKKIRKIEDKDSLTIEDRQTLKDLYEQFNAVYNYVFNN